MDRCPEGDRCRFDHVLRGNSAQYSDSEIDTSSPRRGRDRNRSSPSLERRDSLKRESDSESGASPVAGGSGLQSQALKKRRLESRIGATVREEDLGEINLDHIRPGPFEDTPMSPSESGFTSEEEVGDDTTLETQEDTDRDMEEDRKGKKGKGKGKGKCSKEQKSDLDSDEDEDDEDWTKEKMAWDAKMKELLKKEDA